MASSYFQERASPSPIERYDSSPTLSSPLSPSGGPTPRSSAISNKLTSVLSASYADLEIRDALETLDTRGIQNTPETRRQLRLDVQKEVIECNGEIIREFGQVAEQLKRIGSMVDNLNKYCNEMRGHMNAAHQETVPVLEEASSLMTQKDQVEKKQQLLEAFNKHFIISEEDLTILTSSGEPVNDQFFAILARVKKIHSDCELLLGTENQRLGMDIMEQSTKNLNGGFQKLYRWIQREFKSLNLENPQISASIRRALRVLAERPTLFQSCLDFFAEAREHVLTDAFYTALTGSSTGGTAPGSSKPIELYAHDPLRYIGDMLAWTHSATVSEREALEILFISDGDEIAKGIQAGLENEPWNRTEDGTPVFDGVKALNELVNRDLTGVAQILRQRVEQTIHSHEGVSLAYKIANLINFYRLTFTRMLRTTDPSAPSSASSTLASTLTTLEETAMRQFRAGLQDALVAAQADLAATPSPTDLSPPEFLTTALDDLRAILKSYDASLVDPADRAADFAPILAEALQPFLRCCTAMAHALAREPQASIFTLNCILAARAVLEPYSFTAATTTELHHTADDRAAKLVDAQRAFFLEESGLAPLLAAIAELAPQESSSVGEPGSSAAPSYPESTLRALLAHPAFSIEGLAETAQTLDAFLPSALMDAHATLAGLQSTRLVHDVTAQAAEQFVGDFERVEGVLEALDGLVGGEAGEGQEVEEGVQRLRDVFPRTSGEIRVLLS